MLYKKKHVSAMNEINRLKEVLYVECKNNKVLVVQNVTLLEENAELIKENAILKIKLVESLKDSTGYKYLKDAKREAEEELRSM